MDIFPKKEMRACYAHIHYLYAVLGIFRRVKGVYVYEYVDLYLLDGHEQQQNTEVIRCFIYPF